MNDEKDYLKIASKNSEEEILDNHWETVKRMKIWSSSSGEKTHFKDLEASHLITIVKMLVRFYGERPSQPLQELINALLDETKMRLKMKNSKEIAQPLGKIVVDRTEEHDSILRLEFKTICGNCCNEIDKPLQYCPHCGQKIGKE